MTNDDNSMAPSFPPLFLVDSLVGEAARGGPAGVCLVAGEPSAAWMRALAREVGRPETAFVRRSDAGLAIRWFTPVDEVPLCGYATLAAAHVLYERGFGADGAPLCFASRSGELRASRSDRGIELDFPEHPLTAVAADRCRAAFGVVPRHAYQTPEDLLLVFENADEVRALAPDLSAIGSHHPLCVAATAPAADGYVLRYFAPGWGIAEDDATGSVQCGLAPLWQSLSGQSEFAVHQLSPRGARMHVRIQKGRVFIAGRARTRARLAIEQLEVE